MISLLLVSLALVALVVKYVQYRQQVNQIAGPPVGSFLSGHLGMFLKPAYVPVRQYVVNMYQLLLHLCAEYRQAGAFRLWLGPFHAVFVLTNADSVERLLSSPVNLNKGHEYKFMAPWLGDGLLLADSKVWRTRRKLLTPAFHFKILENFIPIFARHTDALLGKIKAASSNSEEERPTTGKLCQASAFIDDVRPLFEDLTLDIVNETSMGIDHETIHCSANSNESYRANMKLAFRGAVRRVSRPFHWLDSIFRLTEHGKAFYEHVNSMMAYVDKIINKRMNDFKERLKENGNDKEIDLFGSSKKETIFLDILMLKYFSDATSITPENMRSEVNTFILGGHDTTAMALTFSTLLVGLHPKVQTKIYEELEEVFAGDMQRPIDFEDIKRMRYLEMVIKETLRLYPSIQFVARRLTEPLTLPDGKVIQAGNTCYVPIISLHLDPTVYPNPTVFDPERFLPENQQSTNPFAYVPFSAGPRSCIGRQYALLELKFVLASIFRRYRVTAHTHPSEIVKELMPVIKPLNKIKINFEEIC